MSLTRLLQLASPALPVGAYTYSQGLEWAVEAGTVKDEATALTWIGDQLEWNLGRYEAPLLARMMAADDAALAELDAQCLASRETTELRAETLQMGHSLKRLIDDLGEGGVSPRLTTRLREQANDTREATLVGRPQGGTFAAVWSGLAAKWNIAPADALTAWLWSWAENQTMAALKAVPLGQAAGQRILLEIGRRIPDVVERALALDEDSTSNFAPGFAIACARHETQYSRLFRS
ncbi:MAG: urease accessory protein UreF [Rhodocyclales bacterium]|nr:urease accessory protein UreF [Rhodocyclales bacterium]